MMNVFPNVRPLETSPLMRIRQDGTTNIDYVTAVALGIDGSVFLAGTTYGDWYGVNVGGRDFAAAKLDADGNPEWRWQVRLLT